MPTKPIKEILPRSIEPPEFKNYLDSIADKMEEVVNYGTNIFSWITNDKDWEKNDIDMPLILLFKYSLELLDAISILVRQMSIDSCKNLLRILLEVMFYIEYLTEKDTELRSKCYLVGYYKESLSSTLRYVQGTQQNKIFKSKIKKDRYAELGLDFKFAEIEEIALKKSKNLNELLSSPVYEKVVQEYESRRKNNNNPKWYSLFNSNVNSIQELANYLKLQRLYEIIYRGWSNLIHSSDVITGQLVPPQNGKGSFYQIRMGRDTDQVAIYSFLIPSSIYRNMIKYYKPDKEKEFASWYLTEIKPFRDRIQNTRIVVR